MDKRTIVAMVLCFGIFFGWQKLYLEPKMNAAKQAQAEIAAQAEPTRAGAPIPTTDGKVNAAVSPTPVTVPYQAKTMPGRAETAFGNGAQIFDRWQLSQFKQSMKPDAAVIDLQSVSAISSGFLNLDFEKKELAYLSQVRGNLNATDQQVSWSYSDANIDLTRTIVPTGDGSSFQIKLSGTFKAEAPKYAYISIASQGYDGDHEAMDRQLLFWHGDELKRVHVKDALESAQQVTGGVRWIAAASRYFIFAVINRASVLGDGLLQPLAPTEPVSVGEKKIYGHPARASLVMPITANTFEIPLQVYFGPKEVEALAMVEPTLKKAVDYGWFHWLAYPLLKLLKLLQSWVINWGVAIILLTLIVRALVFPLSYKGAKSIKKMSAIQPELNRLKEKYKDDKESLNREMMLLMRTQGYNPLAGCLPILAQMPIFFALYRVLYSSVELYQAPFALWIRDLSDKDPFYITPILLTGVMYVQQRLTPMTGMDPAQQKVMQFMPIIFGAFMISVPSGLTLYMLVSTIAGIAQQRFLNKKLGIGQAPAAMVSQGI